MAEDNISNIINNFKNMMNNDSSSDSSSSNFNITPDMISNLASVLKNNSSSESSADSSDNNNSSSSNIDFETILKIKSIMETLNKKNDPRSNLLYSLKPYLRESRQKKIDQYVNLFKITEISNLFKNETGAKN